MNKQGIPIFFYRLFQWFCKPTLFEELQGDLEEAFDRNVQELGLKKARAIYRKEVMLMFRPSIIQTRKSNSKFNNMHLLKNYLKISLRGMRKAPLHSFINIFGLSIAIGICLVVYTFFIYDSKIDQHHANKESVLLTTCFVNRDGEERQYGTTPAPMGEMMKADIPAITKVCRIKDEQGVGKLGNKVFYEKIRFVDPSFLTMFTFPLKWGDANGLEDVNSVILSESIAIKYFGEENPVGRTVELMVGQQFRKSFQVSGVAAPFPKAHIIEFDFLINFQNISLATPDFKKDSWEEYLDATFIQVEDVNEIPSIEAQLANYQAIQNSVDADWAVTAFKLEPLKTLHHQSRYIQDCISHDYNVESRIGLPIVGLFMLLLACFNNINIAIVSAAKRLREIGLRKVMGAHRKVILSQFLTENLLIAFFALILGYLLAQLVFMPWFVQLSGDALRFDFSDPGMWVFFIGIVIITGLLSGFYPALYISRFQAVTIFKGTVRFGRNNLLTKVFLGIQLVLTCTALSSAVIYAKNTTFQNTRSWGYNQEAVVYAALPDVSNFEALKNSMEMNPDVLSVSGSTHHLGREKENVIVHLPDRQFEAEALSVEPSYFETMGIVIQEGRGFLAATSREEQSIIINEQLAEVLELRDPVGSFVKLDSARYQIVGITREFYNESFYSRIKPTLFKVASPSSYQYLVIKSDPGTQERVLSSLKNEWANFFPAIPFQGGYQEDVWSWFFIQLYTQERFFNALALIAILLASLGLYGLVSINLEGRIREFCIRKSLGANAGHITTSILRSYVVLALVSMIIGAPFSYYFNQANLRLLYANPMPIQSGMIIIAILMVVVVIAMVIFSQIRKVMTINPVEGLRSE